MALTHAGGAIGVPGLYVTDDPGATDSNPQKGVLGLRIGLGQITQLRNRALSRGSLQSATYDGHPACKVNVAKAVNVTVLPLEDAPRGYHDFDKGAAKKFVLDLQGMVRSRRAGSALATAGV